jgi:hypothetical protein
MSDFYNENKQRQTARRFKGDMWESLVHADLVLGTIQSGSRIEKVHAGCDFVETFSDGTEVLHECKATSGAPLSRLQKSTQKKNKKNYVIHRPDL